MSTDRDMDLSGVAQLYAESLRKHGATPMGVGWRDQESHTLRFSKLLSAIDSAAAAEPLVINELGCGYGAFAQHMIAAGLRLRSFRGYDISSEMLDEARTRVLGVPADWIQSAALDQPADYSFASGIFNVRLAHDEASWRSYVEKVIGNMRAHSTRGFAFNILTTYVDFREKHLYYGDPLYFFDYCKRNCSRYVSLLHDYPLYEWTITVRI
jgi:SAM-dependent methyltransferase